MLLLRSKQYDRRTHTVIISDFSGVYYVHLSAEIKVSVEPQWCSEAEVKPKCGL